MVFTIILIIVVVSLLQKESDALKTQNNEMRIRVQALEQQALLKNG